METVDPLTDRDRRIVDLARAFCAAEAAYERDRFASNWVEVHIRLDEALARLREACGESDG